jgi:hypothetical protein
LSAALMSTLRQAIAESARRQACIVEEHLGDDLNLVDQVLEAQAEVFGTTVEELRSKMTEGARPPLANPGDDFSEQSFLTDTDPADPSPRPAPPAAGGSQADAFFKNLFDEEERCDRTRGRHR